MTRLPAYAIDGGQLTADVLRVFGYAATSGARGIASPEDFKVTANGTGSVTIAPGGAVLPTRFVSAPQFQSYAIAMDSAEQFPIPPTGSGSGSTRFLIARIFDQQYGGQAAAAPNWDFALVSSLSNLSYPFVEFARISLPPSTSVVTQAMIEDRRQIAQPRNVRGVLVFDAEGTGNLTRRSPDWSVTPTGVVGLVPTPQWAQKLIVRADIVGAIHRTADVDGRLRVVYGGVRAATSRRYDFSWNGSTTREDITVVAELDIRNRAGIDSHISLHGNRVNGNGTIGWDTQTQVIFEYEFVEDVA